MKIKDSLIQIVKKFRNQVRNQISDVDFTVDYDDDYLTEENEKGTSVGRSRNIWVCKYVWCND